MASRFSVSIDLTDHAHAGRDWTAQHHFVCGLLNDIKQQVGSGPARSGDIVYTGSKDGRTVKTTIGSWEFAETAAREGKGSVTCKT